MKKRIPSFLAGMVSAVLALALCTSALAASGQVTFNFAGVALDGQQKIAAGADITAANGQKIPGSILYTDAAGGKTNYLPVRTISELLDVEVGYDSATRTVLLGRQALSVTPEGRVWSRLLDGDNIDYEYTGEDRTYDAPPAWYPTLPEGWSLSDISATGGRNNSGLRWSFTKEGGGHLTFECIRPSATATGTSVKKDAAASLVPVTVGGRDADLYKGDGVNLLVWEDADGVLFYLSGLNVEASLLMQVAESLREDSGAGGTCLPTWLPKDYVQEEVCLTPAAGSAMWAGTEGIALDYLYAAGGVASLAAPEGTPEAVTVKGRPAQYWAPEETERDGDGATITVGGSTVQASGTVEIAGVTVKSITSSNRLRGTLMWTDADGVAYRLRGALDKETLLRTAESVAAR